MVDFIRDNPATEAFQRGERNQRERLAAEQQIKAQRLQNAFTAESMPSRLRTINARADTAETGTQIADARLRSANAGADMAELNGFFKSLDLLNAGDVESAKIVAAQTGQEIPDFIIENATLRQQVTALAQQAQQFYPNRPQAQKQFMEAATQGLNDEIVGQQNRVDPTYPYNVPGAPQPPETSTAPGARPLQFQVIQDAAIQLGYSPQEAFAIATGQKPPTDMELMNLARQLTTMEHPSSDFRSSAETRRGRYEEILQQLRGSQQPSGSASQGPTVVPSQPATQPSAQGSPFPEYPDARQAQDGNWYVRQGGQWFRIEQ